MCKKKKSSILRYTIFSRGFFLWLGSEELPVCPPVDGCRAYPEGMALQTAAVVQAEAGGSYPAAALCTASIIQRMIQKMIISSKAKQRGALTMSMLSTVKSEERAICRSCTLWLNVKILCPIFASPVPPKGRHHPLPTKPVSSRGAHRRQPGERHRANNSLEV